jgi:LacI family transcriptional regulator
MRIPQKVTMREVARLAGVSPSTVSAVLNGKVLVSEKRTLRVQNAIKALGFEPNYVARSLKTGRTNTVGVIVPDIRITFYPDLLRGIEDAAREQFYTVLFCNSNDNSELEQSLLQAFSARRVDGILLTCSSPSLGASILGFKSCPVVFVDRIPSGVTDWGVTTDNAGAGALATRHLLALGHRRIAILSGRSIFSGIPIACLAFEKPWTLRTFPFCRTTPRKVTWVWRMRMVRQKRCFP